MPPSHPELLIGRLHHDSSRFEGPDDVTKQLRRRHAATRPGTEHVNARLNDQVMLRVRTGHLQRAALQLQKKTGHRSGHATARHGTTGDEQGFEKGVTFATKLHQQNPPLPSWKYVAVVVGGVEMWTRRCLPRSGGMWSYRVSVGESQWASTGRGMRRGVERARRQVRLIGG